MKTARFDLEAKYKESGRAVSIGGPRAGANSGAWTTAVFDYGGVRAHDQQLAIKPRHFTKWKSLQFHQADMGDAFQIKSTKGFVKVIPHLANMRERAFVVAGIRTRCAPGISVSIKYRVAKVSEFTRKGAPPSLVSLERVCRPELDEGPRSLAISKTQLIAKRLPKGQTLENKPAEPLLIAMAMARLANCQPNAATECSIPRQLGLAMGLLRKDHLGLAKAWRFFLKTTPLRPIE